MFPTLERLFDLAEDPLLSTFDRGEFSRFVLHRLEPFGSGWSAFVPVFLPLRVTTLLVLFQPVLLLCKQLFSLELFGVDPFQDFTFFLPPRHFLLSHHPFLPVEALLFLLVLLQQEVPVVLGFVSAQLPDEVSSSLSQHFLVWESILQPLVVLGRAACGAML